MSSQASALPEPFSRRVLGNCDSGIPGPTFLALGGIHGNEPAGVHALHRVLDKLVATHIRGRFIALAGNLEALERGQRYVHRDLNRQWNPDRICKLRTQDRVEDWQEDHEQRELIAEFDRVVETSRGRMVFLDLHSSSGGGPPFVCVGDTLPNRKIARRIPISMILGLEECLAGGVLNYFDQKGLVCLAVEGGSHDDPHTIDNLEAATWLAMFAAGILRENSIDLQPHRETLARATGSLPRALEVRHRHVIKPDDSFTMETGYHSGKRPVGKVIEYADRPCALFLGALC